LKKILYEIYISAKELILRKFITISIVLSGLIYGLYRVGLKNSKPIRAFPNWEEELEGFLIHFQTSKFLKRKGLLKFQVG